MTLPEPALTYTVAQAAPQFPCTEYWLYIQLRSGRFPGRKIAKQWRMTASDIAEAVEICKQPAVQNATEISVPIAPHPPARNARIRWAR